MICYKNEFSLPSAYIIKKLETRNPKPETFFLFLRAILCFGEAHPGELLDVPGKFECQEDR
jgi:hypothetical protein